MRPETVGLRDQADAAQSHALSGLLALAERHDAEFVEIVPGPVTGKILARLRSGMLARSRAGQPTLCDHLSYRAPGVAVWLPYRPGRLRCDVCTGRIAGQVRGTAEDSRCDGCGTLAASIFARGVHVPPLVVDAPPLPPIALPSITVLFGLCRRCRDADDAPEPATTRGGP